MTAFLIFAIVEFVIAASYGYKRERRDAEQIIAQWRIDTHQK